MTMNVALVYVKNSDSYFLRLLGSFEQYIQDQRALFRRLHTFSLDSLEKKIMKIQATS